jgi:hypothetical protein
MDHQAQRPIRWLIVVALLIGTAVWYSWTAHRDPDPHTQRFEPPPREEAQLIRAAVEVPPADDSE